jgi:hypothetical protein
MNKTLTTDLAADAANDMADLFQDMANDLADTYANREPEGPGAFRSPVTGTLYRIRTNKTTGRPYALVARPGATTFVYDWKAIREVSEGMRLTLEEALKYSAQFSECIICGRALTDPNSVAKGIGPVCIKTVAGYVAPVKRARRTKAA